MSNTFTVLMANIIGQALAVLTEEFSALRFAVTDLSGEAKQKGDTIVMSRPIAQTVATVTPAATPPALTDTVPTSVSLTLDRWKGTRFHLTTKDAANIQRAPQFISNQIAEAARGLMYEANAYLLGTLYKGIYGYAGTAGSNPFASTINAAADVREVLNSQFCPDGARRLILGYSAETAALKLSNFNEAIKKGDAAGLQKGEIGDLFGMRVMRDGQVATHTSTPLTAGAATINGVNAAGATTISIAKATNTSPLVVGDVIAIAGIAGTYAVTADVTLAVGNTNVAISPGLASATSGSEVVTLKATHVLNLAVDPGAFGLAIRTLDGDIEGAPQYGIHQIMSDPKTGLALKLSYLPGFEANQWMLSWLYGAQLIDPRRAARLAG